MPLGLVVVLDTIDAIARLRGKWTGDSLPFDKALRELAQDKVERNGGFPLKASS